MPVRPIARWIKVHGLTVVVAVTVFFASNLIARKLSNVDQNQANIRDVCAKVEAVRHYLDALVQRTTVNANQPSVKVADPAVQALIDESRKQNEDFKRFAAEQSRKAECHVRQ